jgi:hypothetical protein
MPMWILMYVFSYSVSPAATNDRAEWRLLPTVVFQEFSNEERCRAAKSTLEGSLKEAGAKLKSGLEDLKALVSVREHLESSESFVIQGRRSDSKERRCGRRRTAVVTTEAGYAIPAI